MRERRAERTLLQDEVEAGGLHAGEGVGRAAVLLQEGLERALLRITLRPEEHHVLTKVREPRPFVRVRKVAGVDLQGCGRLLRVRIVHEQHA